MKPPWQGPTWLKFQRTNSRSFLPLPIFILYCLLDSNNWHNVYGYDYCNVTVAYSHDGIKDDEVLHYHECVRKTMYGDLSFGEGSKAFIE